MHFPGPATLLGHSLPKFHLFPSRIVLEHLQPFHWFDKSVPKADLKSTVRDAGRLKGRACVPNIALRSAVKLQGFLGIQGVG